MIQDHILNQVQTESFHLHLLFQETILIGKHEFAPPLDFSRVASRLSTIARFVKNRTYSLVQSVICKGRFGTFQSKSFRKFRKVLTRKTSRWLYLKHCNNDIIKTMTKRAFSGRIRRRWSFKDDIFWFYQRNSSLYFDLIF